MATKYNSETIEDYEESLTYNQWLEWKRLQKIEREFAKDADWTYDRYWEVLTIQELREAQS